MQRAPDNSASVKASQTGMQGPTVSFCTRFAAHFSLALTLPLLMVWLAYVRLSFCGAILLLDVAPQGQSHASCAQEHKELAELTVQGGDILPATIVIRMLAAGCLPVP